MRCAMRPLVMLIVGLVFGALFVGRARAAESQDGPSPAPTGEGEVQPF